MASPLPGQATKQRAVLLRRLVVKKPGFWDPDERDAVVKDLCTVQDQAYLSEKPGFWVIACTRQGKRSQWQHPPVPAGAAPRRPCGVPAR